MPVLVGLPSVVFVTQFCLNSQVACLVVDFLGLKFEGDGLGAAGT